jgi:diaminopimelate epimerase
MAMALSFQKYHGIGNDFLVVDVKDPGEMTVDRARTLCDRHYGIGADGVLLVAPARAQNARARMCVINADGSTPEMCGNGLRCVVLHLSLQSDSVQERFFVDTDAGLLSCEVDRAGHRALVGTDIGRGTHMGSLTFPANGDTSLYEDLLFQRISTGNPHSICFREQLSDQELDRVGPAVSALIEGGCNVEIATLTGPTEIQLTVWERGVGRTLACGTGAAATAIEAVRSGRSPADTPITVHLPGGDLQLTISPDLRAFLRGPAEWVYSGTTDL